MPVLLGLSLSLFFLLNPPILHLPLVPYFALPIILPPPFPLFGLPLSFFYPPVPHICIPALCPCTVNDYYYPSCFQAFNLLPSGVSHASLHSFLQSRLKMHTAFPAATPLVTGEYDRNYVHLNTYSRILTRARLLKEREGKNTHTVPLAHLRRHARLRPSIEAVGGD